MVTKNCLSVSVVCHCVSLQKTSAEESAAERERAKEALKAAVEEERERAKVRV